MRQLMQTTPGITLPRLARDPIGTEGELTDGPDDFNPFEDSPQGRVENTKLNENPTEGDDPYNFDDVDEEVDSFSLPPLGDGPSF